jgi:ubiquinone biosynthesis accessory factor UbiJ
MPAAHPVLALVNRLLEKEPWARERLAPFAGAIVEARGGPLALRCAIASSGLFEPAPADSLAAVVIEARPGALAVTGQEPLAETLRFLLQHLRWDAEEDLSRFVGDIAARRLVQAGRDFLAWQRDAGARLAQSAVAYLARENGLLVTRPELGALSEGVQALQDAIEALERRTRALE